MHSDHSVIIFFENGLPYPDALYETGFELYALIEKEQIGFYDWHCTAEEDSYGWLYMYGPDVDKLFETVKPVFEKTSFLKNGVVTLRYGPPGTETRHKEIKL